MSTMTQKKADCMVRNIVERDSYEADEQSISGRWYLYTMPPIDFGWDRLSIAKHSFIKPILDIARAHCGWEGDYREFPRVFYVPDENEFTDAYAWKQDNNGTTFVASRIHLGLTDDDDSIVIVDIEKPIIKIRKA